MRASFNVGRAQRHTGTTELGKVHDRSAAIFTVHLAQYAPAAVPGEEDRVMVGQAAPCKHQLDLTAFGVDCMALGALCLVGTCRCPSYCLDSPFWLPGRCLVEPGRCLVGPMEIRSYCVPPLQL